MVCLKSNDNISFVLPPKPVELAALANDFYDYMERLAVEKGVRLRVTGQAV
jgi:hypothetical protein